MPKTIIVSNRLPVRIERDDQGLNYKPSEGGLATGLGSIYKEGNNIWIGWPGLSFDDPKEQQQVSASLSVHNMRPVFLTPKEVELYYLGFSNQILWPAFHYFLHFIQYDDTESWASYVGANEKFADAIVEWLEEDDIIWIHDYQLLLVPQMIRQRFPNVTIGFFQHIPFPSYEVFRTLPWRQQLLDGMLGADYVAFHTYDDMRHFLSSSHRLAGHSYTRNQVLTEDRVVQVDSLPMGIDYKKYYESALSQDAIEREKRYRENVGAERLILSMDRLDYSKGIPQRLKTFDQFLAQHEEYRSKVSLLLIVVPSRDTVPSYQSLKDEVERLVGHINGKYGSMAWTPVHFFYRSYPLGALSAFYRMCDIAMITPMRDGMNLVCKEYIASRHDKTGVLILSEMAGSAKELSDAILVNPNDRHSMVSAIKQALEMPVKEQKRRMSIMQKSLKQYTIFHWVKLFVSNLKQVKEQQVNMTTVRIGKEQRTQIITDFHKARKRLILLDYDGTLVGFHDDPNDSKPDEELKAILEVLLSDPRNQLVVISGRSYDILDEWLGHYQMDFICEHGIWMRTDNGKWQIQIDPNDSKWKEEARELMELYVGRTPGSFVEEKKHALVWHYRKVEKGLGDLRSSELSSHMKHLMASKGIEVIDGNQVVETKPAEVNKGKAALKYLADREFDFIIAFGDDRTDEDTFKALSDHDAYTIKVGSGSSYAKYGVQDHRAVRQLLKILGE